MKSRFKVGDHVLYEGVRYLVEKEYECEYVYLIGNEDSFCDSVPSEFLEKVEDGNEIRLCHLEVAH